jgi:NADPH-dependent 7-cyano-7-deazaguanine reductase QueF-like protein
MFKQKGVPIVAVGNIVNRYFVWTFKFEQKGVPIIAVGNIVNVTSSQLVMTS